MQRVNLAEDVKPVSEFRQNAAAFVQQVRETRRPLVLTQHGKSAAVLLDVKEYEKMVERLHLLESIGRGLEQADRGEVSAHSEVKKRLLARHPG